MAIKFSENFVSYQLNVEDRGIAAAQLDQVRTFLLTASAVATINDLKARQALLQWQVLLEKADADYNHRRYEDALAGYRAVAKQILELLEPKVKKVRVPKTWASGTAITQALTGVGASFLQNLLPEEDEAPPALVRDAVAIDIDKLGADPAASLAVTQTVPQAIMDLAQQAGAAAGQGQWTTAAGLYQKALDGAANDPHLSAEILLNLGAAQIQSNQAAQAIPNLRRAQEMFQRAGDQMGVAETLHNIGYAQLRTGSGPDAVKSLADARQAAGQATLHGLLQGQGIPAPVAPGSPGPEAGGAVAARPVLAPGAPAAAMAAPALALNFPSAITAGPAPTLGSVRAAILNTAQLPAQLTTVVREVDVEKAAGALGTADFELKFRPIGKQVAMPDLKLVTPAQQQAESFGRTFTLRIAGQTINLNWTNQQVLATSAVADLLKARATSAVFIDVGFRPAHPSETAVLLPHLYQLVLPIKMGDCLRQLNQFAQAHQEYLRASQYEGINKALEAPDLWRRMAENVADWGDSLYRDDQTQAAVPVYELLMKNDFLASNSEFYTSANLAPTGQAAAAWLKALKDETPLPDLNPAVAQVMYTLRTRWIYISAGLDFFGALADAIPPFTFRYLQEAARYFANRAIQAEQRYIEFYTRFESGEMTRRELQNSYEQSLQGVEIARQNQEAAQATVAAANSAVNLANVRHQGAQDLLNDFNGAAWEMEALSGLIARGNAWTGGDLPNLKYTVDGYTYEGKKHEVLQQLTQRQTQISNDLQSTRMQATINELAAGQDVANKQVDIAVARSTAAATEARLAEMRRDQARQMRDAFDDQKFNPEQWLAMAGVMKGLAGTALDRGIEIGRLMERTYNFENFDNRKVIRSSYKLAQTQDLLGGELLLNDIDSFTFYHLTRVNQKPIPVKWAVSLTEEFPGQFLRFSQAGRMDFDIDLERLALAQPGTYRHQIKGVEVEVDGFLPPSGLHGRLTNSGLGRYRDSLGQAHLRVQPAETMMLSRYNRRQDSLILSPPPDMRNLFEGNSAASGWTLEVPRSANDADLRLVFDIRLVLYFECLFDQSLFQQDAAPPQGLRVERTRALDLRQHYPDVYFQLRETGKARIELTQSQFPLNQLQPVLVSLALAITPEANETLSGARLKVSYPGQGVPVNVTVSADNAVPKAGFPIGAAQSALGVYEIELDPADLARKDQIQDLNLVMDYRFTPAT